MRNEKNKIVSNRLKVGIAVASIATGVACTMIIRTINLLNAVFAF